MGDDVYRHLQQTARRIASTYPTPEFYRFHPIQRRHSMIAFAADPVLGEIRSRIARRLEDNFGHGVSHAVRVTLDAGSLMLIEGRLAGYGTDRLRSQVRVAQCAGLLHDICRRERDHAVAGADLAARLLRPFPFSPEEREDICHAIRNHEAFKPTTPASTPGGDLVAGCLYDADKFRWGPDNFTSTIWEMVAASGIDLPRFVAGYPRAMRFLSEIRGTFRTPTGRRYGPQFIDVGMAIGRELLETVRSEYGRWL